MSTVGRAPGRVNIIGEHTDYNGGLVLPMAIHLGVTATVDPRADRLLVMRSAQVPDEVVALDLGGLAPGCCSGWAAYVAGAVWSVGLEHPLRGLDITIDGDVPLGAGLSSSAAVECAVVVAVAAALGVDAPRRELARWAQRAENEFVGVPTGSMDQVASMMGAAGSALLYDVRADTVEPVPADVAAHGAEFLVIDTRASHALVDGGYADRRATCERAAELLGVHELREVIDLDAALATLASSADGDRLTRRTRHVVTETARVLDAVVALREGDLPRLGMLMLASHASLRDDFEVSCPELDTAVDAAMAAGAIGARMTGGGFGGSAIVLLPRAARAAVIDGVTAAFAARGFTAPAPIPVTAAAGASVIPSGE